MQPIQNAAISKQRKIHIIQQLSKIQKKVRYQIKNIKLKKIENQKRYVDLDVSFYRCIHYSISCNNDRFV